MKSYGATDHSNETFSEVLLEMGNGTSAFSHFID